MKTKHLTRLLLIVVVAILAGMVTLSHAETKRVRVPATSMTARCKDCPKPQYPPTARQLRVQGTVDIYLVVGTDGKVQQAKLVSGHPLLADSALATVKAWTFEPLVESKETVEAETEITVRFALDK